MKELPAEQLRVLSQIQNEANEKFGKSMFIKRPAAKEVLKVFDEAVKLEIPEWKRKYYAAMRKSFEGDEVIVNEKVAEIRDKFVDRRIKQAIKKGLLPKYV